MNGNKEIRKITVIGTGAIGASWAALYLARGFNVVATDPAPNAEANLRRFIDAAWKDLSVLGLWPNASRDHLGFTQDLKQALSDTDFVQESGPEREDFKIKLFADIDAATPPESIIASSSSGLKMSVIQSACKHPERSVIGHPFNPPHMIPLVEVVAGARTSAETVQRALSFYRSIGKKAIHVRKEMVGHVANRIQGALYREVVYLIEQGVLDVADADAAVCWGPGLRWGIMGPNLLFHLGGGQGGIQHFMDHLSGPVSTWWKDLGTITGFTPQLKQTIVDGVLKEAGNHSIEELEQERNTMLLELLAARANGEKSAQEAVETGNGTLARTALVNSILPNIAKSKLTKASSNSTSGRLFFLDLGGGRVLSSNPDGTDLKTVVSEGRRLPDGLVVNVAAGHLYWTNMGDPKANDGSIERADLDGSHRTTIVPVGGTFTPKQLQLDRQNGKIYWSDREGMRVKRSNLDGSDIETLVETGHGEADRLDARNWCVGIALNVQGGKLYWTQKGNDNAGQGRIFRANLEIPKGQTPANRKDIELLFDRLPEPIDLELDLSNRMMYWTDRGDPPRGNTVNRAPMDVPPGRRKDPEIVFTHLMEGIGLALDLKGGRMFITDFGGSVYSADLDGSNQKTLLFYQGNLTGIAYAELPTT